MPRLLTVCLLQGLLCWMATAAAAQNLSVAQCPAGAVVLSPGRSIQAAADAAGPGTRFCLTPGLYRQQSVTPLDGQQFFGLPGSILNGSQALGGFQRSGTYWVARAADPIGADGGVCARGRGACARPAGLFLDGLPLKRAATLADMAPGQFFFDPERRRVMLAADPTGRMVEWAMTRHAFAGMADNVTIEGLVLEKYANPAQEGTVWPGGNAWTLRRLEARFNNGVGLVAGSGGVIENSNVHHNGQLGIGAGGASNVVIHGNQIWANNTNGFDDTWEAGGLKFAECSHVVLSGNDVHDNNGPGLWGDENCQDTRIEGNTVKDNASAGIFYEISSNATISGNVLSGNGAAGLSWFWGAEIQVAASRNVVVSGNTLTVRPGGKAVVLIDQNRQRAGGGYYQTRNDSIQDNHITFLGDGLAGGVSDAGPGAANDGIIQHGGNQFDRNAYFVRPGATLGFAWGRSLFDLDAFRGQGQERLGTLTGIAADATGQAVP